MSTLVSGTRVPTICCNRDEATAPLRREVMTGAIERPGVTSVVVDLGTLASSTPAGCMRSSTHPESSTTRGLGP